MAETSTGSSDVTASAPSGDGGELTIPGRIIAAAVLASRLDSPTRNPPVISFSKAQRPLGSKASSQPSSRPLTSARVAVRKASTTSPSSGSRLGLRSGGAGQIRATVSARSPT